MHEECSGQMELRRGAYLPILPVLSRCDEGPPAGVRVVYPGTPQHFRLHHTATLNGDNLDTSCLGIALCE